MVEAKPVVTFRAAHLHNYQIEQYSDRQFAKLYGVKGHPRLGNPHTVYTSMIEKVENDEDGIKTIETQNTLYSREL